MKTYIFIGRVLPERENINIPTLKSNIYTSYGAISADIIGTNTISISSSQIYIKTDIDDDIMYTFEMTPEDLRDNARDNVEQDVREIIDIYGYLYGKCFDVEITSIIDENGDFKIFDVGNDKIKKIIRDNPLFSQRLEFNNIFDISSNSVYLRRALGDLRDAIRSSSLDTGLYCFRAIEDIRNHFGEDIFLDDYDSNDANQKIEAWEALNNNLCINKSYTDQLKVSSTRQRHGSIFPVIGNDRDDIILRTLKIINRFIIYLHNDSEPLSKIKLGWSGTDYQSQIYHDPKQKGPKSEFSDIISKIKKAYNDDAFDIMKTKVGELQTLTEKLRR